MKRYKINKLALCWGRNSLKMAMGHAHLNAVSSTKQDNFFVLYLFISLVIVMPYCK